MIWSVVSPPYLSAKLGLGEDKIRFSLCLFLCLPLAQLYRTLLSVNKVSPTVRHLTSITFGVWITWFCCGWYVIHLLFVSLLCYAAMLVVHPLKVSWVVMALSFTCLAYVHLERVLSLPENYKIDVSGRLMLLVQKLAFVAWSISDSYEKNSRKDDNEIETSKQRKRLVPNPLLYFGYLFHFASLLVGPVVSYDDYVEYINGTDIEKYSPKDSKMQPNPYWDAFESFIAAIICAVMYTVGRKYLSLERLADPLYIEQIGLPIATIHLLLSSNVIRLRYYFAWKMGESATALSGLGFTGYDANGISTWNNCRNINIVEFLKNSDIIHRTRTWNISAHRWIKSCVYSRLQHHKLEITYLIVAIWHGFYAGYFVCVFSFIFYLKSSDVVKRSLTPLVQRQTGFSHYLIRFFWWLFEEMMLAYTTAPFTFLTLEKSLHFFGNMYYAGHLLAIAIIVYGQLFTVKVKKDSTIITNGVNNTKLIDNNIGKQRSE